MIDPDLTAYVDPVTGIPQVDGRSTAQRWRDALNHSSGREPFQPTNNFGPVGAETKLTKQLSGTDRRNENAKHTIMKRNPSKPGLIEASPLELADIKELLLKYGHPVIDEGEFLAIPTPFFGLYININCENSIVDLSGAIALARNTSLRKQLRLVNWLNNSVPLVRFSLAQSADLDKGIDLVHQPDGSDLWGNIALPVAGFSRRQFVVAFDALITGLIHAYSAAVETGFVDAPMCEACAEQLQEEEDSYVH